MVSEVSKKVSMFEQTFVEVKSKAPPYALALSLFTQVLVLAVLLLLPLVYTQVLPGVSLRSVLAAPAPPPVPQQRQLSIQKRRSARFGSAEAFPRRT